MWQLTKILVDLRRRDLVRAAEQHRHVRAARPVPRRHPSGARGLDADTAYRRCGATPHTSQGGNA